MTVSPYNVKQNQPYQPPGTTLTATGTINKNYLQGGHIALAGSSAITITISSPAVSDDRVRLSFLATTAQAHIIVYPTIGFNGGGAGGDTATLGGAKGDNIQLEAQGGVWYIVSSVNATLS